MSSATTKTPDNMFTENGAMTGSANVKVDVNFAGTFENQSDNINGITSNVDTIKVKGNITGTRLSLDGINVINGWEGEVGSYTTIKLIDSNNITGLTIDSTEIFVGAYKYVFTQQADNSGILKVVKDNGFTLAQIVGNKNINEGTGLEPLYAGNVIATSGNNKYILETDYVLDADLGEFKDLTVSGASHGRTLTVVGNGHKLSGTDVDGNEYQGFILRSFDTLTLNGLASIDNFAEQVILNNGGTVNIAGTTSGTEINSRITNKSGSLNLTSGKIIVNADIGDNSGSLNVSGADVINNKTITQKALNITAGSLKSNVSNLKINSSISNAGTLTLTGLGTLANVITGKGNIVADGNITFSGSIENSMYITETATVTATSNNSAITGKITNDGILTIFAANIGNDIVNNNSVTIQAKTGGTIKNNITGENGVITVSRYRQPGKRGIMPASAVSYYNRIDIGIFLCILELCMQKQNIAFERALFVDDGSDREYTKAAEYRLN